MIKYWQSMHDYLYFLNKSKINFDSSERTRLHSELWEPWQKLRSFNTDRTMGFLQPFYSTTGRSAKNQPQILRSFILFFLLYSKGLTPSSFILLYIGMPVATPYTSQKMPINTLSAQKRIPHCLRYPLFLRHLQLIL